MGFKEFIASLSRVNCFECGLVIPEGERYYIEYPATTYCADCAKSKDGF